MKKLIYLTLGATALLASIPISITTSALMEEEVSR